MSSPSSSSFITLSSSIATLGLFTTFLLLLLPHSNAALAAAVPPASSTPTSSSASTGLDHLALIAGTVVGCICGVVALAVSAHTCIRVRARQRVAGGESRSKKRSSTASSSWKKRYVPETMELARKSIGVLPAAGRAFVQLETPPPSPLEPPSPALTHAIQQQQQHHQQQQPYLKTPPSPPQPPHSPPHSPPPSPHIKSRKPSHKRTLSTSSRFSTRSHSYDTRALLLAIESEYENDTETETETIVPSLPAFYKAIVAEPYETFEEDELELKVGDLVNVFKVFEDGWGWGVNTTSGCKGVFPVVCLSSL